MRYADGNEARAEARKIIRELKMCVSPKAEVRQAKGGAFDKKPEHPTYGKWWVKANTPDDVTYVAPGGLPRHGAHWFDSESEACAAATAYEKRNPDRVVAVIEGLLRIIEGGGE